MEKKLYEKPEVEMVVFEAEDVMTTSSPIDEGIGGENDLPIA